MEKLMLLIVELERVYIDNNKFKQNCIDMEKNVNNKDLE